MYAVQGYSQIMCWEFLSVPFQTSTNCYVPSSLLQLAGLSSMPWQCFRAGHERSVTVASCFCFRISRRLGSIHTGRPMHNFPTQQSGPPDTSCSQETCFQGVLGGQPQHSSGLAAQGSFKSLGHLTAAIKDLASELLRFNQRVFEVRFRCLRCHGLRFCS